MHTIQEDGSGQPYIEVRTLRDEHVRVTWIDGQKAGYHTDSLRFVIRQADGRLKRYGPEVPVASVGEFMKAVTDLMTHCKKGSAT